MSTAVTYLFVPGDRPERFDKAAAAGPDVMILDLEDAVHPDAKPAARGCEPGDPAACARSQSVGVAIGGSLGRAVIGRAIALGIGLAVLLPLASAAQDASPGPGLPPIVPGTTIPQIAARDVPRARRKGTPRIPAIAGTMMSPPPIPSSPEMSPAATPTRTNAAGSTANTRGAIAGPGVRSAFRTTGFATCTIASLAPPIAASPFFA